MPESSEVDLDKVREATRRRSVWVFSAVIGAGGAVLLALGFLGRSP